MRGEPPPVPDPLGIIAGSRSLPLEIARLARAAGVRRLVAVAFEGETDPSLASLVDEVVYLKVGQLSRLIKAFGQRGVRQCVMGGQIAPQNLFRIRPDLRAAALLWRLKERNARTIFGGIAEELAKEGIQLIEATPWLAPLMPGAGEVLGRPLPAGVREDLAFGMRIAKEVSRMEIGQSVVVKEGTVLAVEGFEGTDPCLERGGALAGRRGGGPGRQGGPGRPRHALRHPLRGPIHRGDLPGGRNRGAGARGGKGDPAGAGDGREAAGPGPLLPLLPHSAIGIL